MSEVTKQARESQARGQGPGPGQVPKKPGSHNLHEPSPALQCLMADFFAHRPLHGHFRTANEFLFSFSFPFTYIKNNFFLLQFGEFCICESCPITRVKINNRSFSPQVPWVTLVPRPSALSCSLSPPFCFSQKVPWAVEVQASYAFESVSRDVLCEVHAHSWEEGSSALTAMQRFSYFSIQNALKTNLFSTVRTWTCPAVSHDPPSPVPSARRRPPGSRHVRSSASSGRCLFPCASIVRTQRPAWPSPRRASGGLFDS